MQPARSLVETSLSDFGCVSSLLHIRSFNCPDDTGHHPKAPAKAPAKAVDVSEARTILSALTCAVSPAPLALPSRGTLDFFCQMLRFHIPTAQVNASQRTPGEFDCSVAIGSQEDLVLATELSAYCGMMPSAVAFRVSNRIEPAALFCLNTVIVAQAMKDPSGRIARVIATDEVYRCIVGAEVDTLCAPAASPHTDTDTASPEELGSVPVERQMAAPPTIFVRVPPPSTTSGSRDALARARAVVARIRNVLPHARLRIEVVEGSEEDLMFTPELGGVGITFTSVLKPPHPPEYPLTSDARLLSPAARNADAAGVAGPGSGGASNVTSLELVDDQALSSRVKDGHVTVGAFGKNGWDLVSTGHSFPKTLREGMVREGTQDVGFRADLVAKMNPAQFDGTAAMAYVECADAEPGAAGRDDSPVDQADVLRLVADASLFRFRPRTGPAPACTLAPMPQLARWRDVLGSSGDVVDAALALPPWAEYCGEVEIWGVHGKDKDSSGAVRSRLADVLGYSTKMLPVRFVAGRAVRACTVVYVAKMRAAVPSGDPPLCCGDSGGAATQTRAVAARRLHSLVAARAWHSVDGGVTKDWYVLLVPIHFVVAQIARLLREQRSGAAHLDASEASSGGSGGAAASDSATTTATAPPVGVQLEAQVWADAEPLSEPPPRAAVVSGASGGASAT